MNDGFFWRIFKHDVNVAKRYGPELQQVYRLHYMDPGGMTSAGFVQQYEPTSSKEPVRFTITSNLSRKINDVSVDSLQDGMTKIEWFTHEFLSQRAKSNYMLITDPSLLKGLNTSHKGGAR